MSSRSVVTWSEIGLASSTPAATSARHEAQVDADDRHAAWQVRALQAGHERVEDERDDRGGDEEQHHRPRRLDDREAEQQQERQRDELDPARNDGRLGRAAAAARTRADRGRRSRRRDGAAADRREAGPRRAGARSSPRYARVCAVPDVPASILFIGDVVGGLGRRTLLALLPGLVERHEPTFVVVNAENVAGGLGITPKIADELLGAGVDVITLGNHAYHRKEIYPYLDAQERIIRPANYLRSQPGRGWAIVEHGGVAPRGGQPQRQPLPARRAARLRRDRRRARPARGQGRPRPGRHARRGDEREGRHGLVPRRPRDRRGGHAHPRPDRRRARPARRHRLHHRRRDDRPARRRHRRAQGAGDRVAAHPHVRALRDVRGRPVAHGRPRALRGRAAARGVDRAAAAPAGSPARPPERRIAWAWPPPQRQATAGAGRRASCST